MRPPIGMLEAPAPAASRETLARAGRFFVASHGVGGLLPLSENPISRLPTHRSGGDSLLGPETPAPFHAFGRQEESSRSRKGLSRALQRCMSWGRENPVVCRGQVRGSRSPGAVSLFDRVSKLAHSKRCASTEAPAGVGAAHVGCGRLLALGLRVSAASKRPGLGHFVTASSDSASFLARLAHRNGANGLLRGSVGFPESGGCYFFDRDGGGE